MKIISAKYIITPESILSDKALLVGKNIERIGEFEDLKRAHPNAEAIELKTPTVLLPGLINSHVHLEFSGNRTSLEYGSFNSWLSSIIQKRESLIGSCNEKCIDEALKKMLKSGTTTVGAVSSYSFDLNSAIKTPQKIIFFSELIGSQAQMADALWADFLSRLGEAQKHRSEYFTPAIAIHSPYSVHPILVKKAVALAKEHKTLLSTHFLESPQEMEWLQNEKGLFKEFFESFLNQSRPATDIEEFLGHFENYPTLFVHATQAENTQLKAIKKSGHTVAHAPVSNRLLGNGRLNINTLNEMQIPYALVTDGLSSNYSLNLFEEMRMALFMHYEQPLNSFAHELINSATVSGANALQIRSGRIEEGYAADLILIELPSVPNSLEEVPLHTILHHEGRKQIYINGERQ